MARDPHGHPGVDEEMAQMIEEDDSLTVCLESEFPTRDDGLVLFEDAADIAADFLEEHGIA